MVLLLAVSLYLDDEYGIQYYPLVGPQIKMNMTGDIV